MNCGCSGGTTPNRDSGGDSSCGCQSPTACSGATHEPAASRQRFAPAPPSPEPPRALGALLLGRSDVDLSCGYAEPSPNGGYPDQFPYSPTPVRLGSAAADYLEARGEKEPTNNPTESLGTGRRHENTAGATAGATVGPGPGFKRGIALNSSSSTLLPGLAVPAVGEGLPNVFASLPRADVLRATNNGVLRTPPATAGATARMTTRGLAQTISNSSPPPRGPQPPGATRSAASVGSAVFNAPSRQVGDRLAPSSAQEDRPAAAVHTEAPSRQVGDRLIPSNARTEAPAGSQSVDRDAGGAERPDVRTEVWTQLAYGRTSAEFPARWLSAYIAEATAGGGPASTLMSTVDEAMSFIWRGYWEIRVPQSGNADSLLRCYNIPFDIGDRYYHYTEHGGAPLAFWREMCHLVNAFSEHITPTAPNPACDGFSEFVVEMLKGNRARVGSAPQTRAEMDPEAFEDPSVEEGKRSYWARPRCRTGYVSVDIISRYLDNPDWTSPAFENSCSRAPNVPCSDGFGLPSEERPSFRWDEYSIQIANINDTEWLATVTTPGGTSGGRAQFWAPPYPTEFEGRRFKALGGGFRIQFHAIQIAAGADIVDRLLFAARATYDYVPFLVESGDIEAAKRYLQSSREFGKMALAYISAWSRILVHEFGHLYVGGGHCTWQCCFDGSAARMVCAISARVGLPFFNADEGAVAYSRGAWERGPRASIRNTRCSSGGNLPVRCMIPGGVDGYSDAAYCEEGCTNAIDPQALTCAYIPG